MSEPDVPFIDAILPALGGMLAGGVFLVPAMACDLAGPASIFSLVLASAVALSMARLSVAPVKRPRSLPRFLLAWTGVAGRLAAVAAIAIVLSAYVLPHASQPERLVAAAAVTLFCAGLVLSGVRPSPSAVSVATGVALVGLGFYAGLSAPLMSRSGFVPLHPHGWGAVLPATTALLFLFGGGDYVGSLAPVLARPDRNIPKGAVLGAAMMAAVVIVVMVVSIGVGGSAFTMHRLFSTTEDQAPLLAIAGATGQPVALLGLRLGALAACGVGIHRLLSEASQALASLARLGDLPPALGSVTPGEAPVAVVLAAPIAIVLLYVASSTALVGFAAACVLIVYALLVGSARARPSALGGVATAAAGLMVVLAALAPRPAPLALGAVLLLGVAVRAAGRLWKTP